MANIAEIDLGKLLPYAEGRRKSFEELMYQLAYSQYEQELTSGRYSITSIDDSGGGDGVEFYITKDDGKVIGWQAKYFRETRFGPSQRTQVQRSLQKAYEEHGDNLEEWILCSRGAFGVDGEDDESTWFKGIGSRLVNKKRVLPENCPTRTTHWNESELHRKLANNPHIQNYFFNEKALTSDWFEGLLRQYQADDRVARKYIPDVHVSMDEDSQIYQVLGYPEFKGIFEDTLSKFEVRENCLIFNEGYGKLLTTILPDKDHEAFRQELLKIATPDKQNIAQNVLELLCELSDMVVNDQSTSSAYRDIWTSAKEQYRQFDQLVNDYDKRYREVIGTKLADLQYDETTDFSGYTKEEREQEQKRRERTRDLFGFYSVRLDAFLNIFRCFQSVGQAELHISGAAGHGKTHLAFHTFKTCVEGGRPALFMLAKDIHSIDDIPKLASTPRDWDISTLLGALEIAGRVAGMRIPIIIDGLNETTSPEDVWHDGIPRLVSMLKAHYPHVILITTYRSSYKELLFGTEYFKEASSDYFSYPFSRQFYLPDMDSELSLEAIQKYFHYYKIRISSGYLPGDVFTHPLYLRLFCEAKNHERHHEIVIATISKSDTYGVFRDYIDQAAVRIQREIGDPRYDKRRVHEILLEIALKFWNSKSRSLTLRNNGLSRNELSSFESEDLLLYRDYDPYTGSETLSFTYDAVGGYIIAQTLMEMIDSKTDLAAYLTSADFVERIVQEISRHQLHEDILRAMCTLAIEQENIGAFLFEVSNEEYLLEYCFEELFETDPIYLIPKNDIVRSFVLSRLNTTRARSNMLGLSEPHWFEEGHPFNFRFISEWLASLSMPERDLTWSEHIRGNAEYFEEVVEEIYTELRSKKLPANIDLKAPWLTWLLTTTIRNLRDESTRCLYWYGRNNPLELFGLIKQFIGCSDPYVSERLLAALYGVAMASRGLPDVTVMKEFTDVLLPEIGRYLYQTMFASGAEYPTTHILTRDYAKRIIDLTLMTSPDVLTSAEQKDIRYPLAEYPHPEWDEMKDDEIDQFKEGAHPIRMDFDNYTIGRLVPNRMPYDTKDPSYAAVRASIYWRLKDLGYDSQAFSTPDKVITRLGSYARNSFEERAGKIDRYGKKYSWIAFFEMAGRLNDDEILKDDGSSERAVRMSDIGIDPSFPSLPTEDYYERIGETNLLGGNDVKQWLHDSSDVDIKSYLISDKVLDGEWVLIKARISQEDADDQTRDTTIDISAILVNESDEKKLKQRVMSGEEFRFGIVEGAQAYYTFDGELPWSPYMPSDNSEELVVESGTKFDVTDSFSVKAETLFYSSEWESYHSQLNPSGQTVTPNKSLANKHGLRLIPQTSDMCDANGKVIAKTLSSKLTPFGQAKFTYVRKDALLGYIGDKKLVWSTWCEKRWWKDGLSSSTHRDTETDFIEHCRLDFLSDC